MHRVLPLLAIVAVVFSAIVFTGCTKDSVVSPSVPTSDEQALVQQVTSVDSVAAFSSSDEMTIDDNGLRDPDYEGLAKEAAMVAGNLRSAAGDSLYPVRWGRHIRWSTVTRDYHVIILGDTEAIVTIVKTLPGEFWVGWGSRTADTVVIDTIIKKPFTEVVTRQIRFRRIAHTDQPLRNWVPVAITLVQGKTEGASTFAISSMEFIDASTHYDSVVTDPTNTWFRLGWRRGTIPIVRAGDSVTVRVTITSSDDSSEIAVFRHGIGGTSLLRGRTRMPLVSVSGTSGNYTRIYEKTFRPGLRLDVFAARFNAVVDVLSRGSIFDKNAPFTNEFWGIPYIVTH